MFEGIIETDHWFGPLFNNLRITKTDIPVEFRSDVPFLQVQPVHKDVYADKFLQNYAVKNLDQLSREDWDAFHRTVVVPNTDPERRLGHYAVSVRKKAHQPTLATNLGVHDRSQIKIRYGSSRLIFIPCNEDTARRVSRRVGRVMKRSAAGRHRSRRPSRLFLGYSPGNTVLSPVRGCAYARRARSPFLFSARSAPNRGVFAH